MSSNISEEEVWLRSYCSVLSGISSEDTIKRGYLDASTVAKACADQAVVDFEERFPRFRFHSNENK